ncbi:MAG: phage/plasmid primase, P4 family [Candidatus Eremiobacteraeota bacterium]|nr:phage/plasmid primase, P4 family [Candidatus Eremiobacteraeota bacterium]
MLDLGDIFKQKPKEAALIMLRMGIQPVPIPPGMKGPILKDWPNFRCTPDEAEKYFPDEGNIGALCGEPSRGLLCIDLDCLEAITVAAKVLPETGMKDGRKSRPCAHWFYRVEEGVYEAYNDPEEGGRFIEVLWNGHQAVIPPSVQGGSGETREWVCDRGDFSPAAAEFEELRKKVSYIAAVCLIARRWKQGTRQELALLLAGAFAHGGIEEKEAVKFIRLVCQASEDEEREKRIDTIETTYGKLGNGEITTGIPKLKEFLGERVFAKLETWLKLKKPIEKAKEYNRSDKGNAERLADKEKGNVHWVDNLGGFFVWNGTYWECDTTKVIYHKALETIEDMQREGHEQKNQELQKHALQCEALYKVLNMVDFLKILPGIAIKPEIFDQQPWLLNCDNGTIDLRTAEFYTHRREDYFTRRIYIPYIPSAQCPRWLKFLDQIMNGNRNLISFLQRMAGYTLTGITREEVFVFLYGTGANGKSTFLSTVSDILGPYTMNVLTTMFISDWQSKRDDSSLEKASLKGVRMVITEEIPEGRMNATAIKQLTGSEKVKGRFHRKDFLVFMPEFKVWMHGNTKPTIRTVDEGIRRRYLMVPFDVTIPLPERDKCLSEKLRAESSGILNWLIEGCMIWQRDGLNPPEEVISRTNEHLYDEDSFRRFFEDCCQIGNPDNFISNKAIQVCHREWSQTQGELELSPKGLANKLKSKGCIKAKFGGVRGFSKLILIKKIADFDIPSGHIVDLDCPSGISSSDIYIKDIRGGMEMSPKCPDPPLPYPEESDGYEEWEERV